MKAAPVLGEITLRVESLPTIASQQQLKSTKANSPLGTARGGANERLVIEVVVTLMANRCI